jgi:hypothetical protein
MLSAVGVVLLWFGSFVQVADISMAVVASLMAVFAVIEYSKGAPWTVFAVTSVLSLLLLPNKSPALMYTLFFGFYPILKERFEKLGKVISWVCKLCVFNISLVLIAVASKLVLAESAALPVELYIIGFVIAQGVFVLYDVALTRLISFYIYRLRKRLGFKN